MLPLLASAVVALAPHPPACARTYTVAMVRRADIAAYSGTRDVTARDRASLDRFFRCRRNRAAGPYLRWFRASRAAAWRARRNPPMYAQLASWYEDAGATASGWHSYYGVANKSLPFGTRVRICYGGNCVDAVVDDRGPYVGGRVWDLNQNVAGALGFDGVATVLVSVPG